ncbi:MAG: DUF2066 domain-containing protein [Marinagarivorans sp.]|nr:DUF2066 domain-containing protein [Marinagarivorans sp.]
MRQLVLCLVVLLIMGKAVAGENYFSARIPVANQETSVRQEAIQKALEQVVIKISGRLDAPTKITDIKDASRYLRQFRYSAPSDVEREAGVVTLLQVEFDAAMVRNLLKSSGLNLWPENRPQVLVWAIEDSIDGGRQLITNPKHPIILELLAQAQLRGLPILLPLWDLDDQLLLNDEQLWSFDSESLLSASSRYDVNTILAARYTETSLGEWLGSWQLMHADVLRSYDVRSPSLTDMAVAAINPAVDLLVERYAVNTSAVDAGELKNVVVKGITNYAQYQSALAYLKKQPLISSVSLVAIKGDELHFKVSMSASWQQLNNAFALDRTLRLQTPALEPWQMSTLGTEAMPAVYQWQ